MNRENFSRPVAPQETIESSAIDRTRVKAEMERKKDEVRMRVINEIVRRVGSEPGPLVEPAKVVTEAMERIGTGLSAEQKAGLLMAKQVAIERQKKRYEDEVMEKRRVADAEAERERRAKAEIEQKKQAEAEAERERQVKERARQKELEAAEAEYRSRPEVIAEKQKRQKEWEREQERRARENAIEMRSLAQIDFIKKSIVPVAWTIALTVFGYWVTAEARAAEAEYKPVDSRVAITDVAPVRTIRIETAHKLKTIESKCNHVVGVWDEATDKVIDQQLSSQDECARLGGPCSHR